MFTRVQSSSECKDLTRTPKANDSLKTTEPENTELFQTVIKPPKLPREGTYANLSRRLGHNDLT